MILMKKMITGIRTVYKKIPVCTVWPIRDHAAPRPRSTAIGVAADH